MHATRPKGTCCTCKVVDQDEETLARLGPRLKCAAQPSNQNSQTMCKTACDMFNAEDGTCSTLGQLLCLQCCCAHWRIAYIPEPSCAASPGPRINHKPLHVAVNVQG